MCHGWPAAGFALICLIVPGSGCGDGVELTEPEMDFAGSEFIQREHSGPGTESPDLTGDGSESQPLPEGSLRFTLQKGDHFPLRKHVTQTLVQNLPGGEVTSRSDLKLMFAITVDGEDKGRRQLGVRYQRVQYSLELPGQRTKYDSKSPPEFVPDSLQMYHGLANNGFDFWIGADNRIVHLDGFQDFLKRCVRFAPPERQHELLAGILVGSEDEGFANFVDDSIGLLPYNPDAAGRETMVRVNDSWSRNRDLREPLPMRIRTTYTLTDLTEHQAHIAVLGTIEPITATQLSPVEQASFEQSLQLKSGQVIGTIIIDVATGLPLESRVERRLTMVVFAQGQQPFQQYKTLVTEIDAYPAQGVFPPRQPAAGPLPSNYAQPGQ